MSNKMAIEQLKDQIAILERNLYNGKDVFKALAEIDIQLAEIKQREYFKIKAKTGFDANEIEFAD